MRTITFDKSIETEVFSAFDKTIDTQGYIVEKNDINKRVITPEGEEIKSADFGAIRKGSEIFIKSDLISLIDLWERECQKSKKDHRRNRRTL